MCLVIIHQTIYLTISLSLWTLTYLSQMYAVSVYSLKKLTNFLTDNLMGMDIIQPEPCQHDPIIF